MRYGMILDSKRCIGCYSCRMAGKAENATPPGAFPARMLEKEDRQYPSVGRTFFPVLCNHCEE